MKIMFGNECPIRIAHDNVGKMFGLAIVRTDAPPAAGMDPAPSVSSLRLLDDVSFARMSSAAIQMPPTLFSDLLS
jgi:hypothetical protein